MAENNSTKKDVMEILQAQQDLLQKLYTELDVEREASATATDESLAMIVRLQGEKAAVQMEASQYKRIAEEKMFHAQETLDIFRDLIHQKEMQIASLEFQVQAYKFKLVSLGCKDFGDNDTSIYPVNMLSRTSTLSAAQPFPSRAVRRGCSLPPDFLNDGDSPIIIEKTVSAENSLKLGHSRSGDFTSYWQQLKRLDERVKELSISKDLFDADNSNKEEDAIIVEEVRNLLDIDQNGASNIHDIFEVPQAVNSVEFADLSPKPDSNKTVISGGMVKNNWNDEIMGVSCSDVDEVFPKPRDEAIIEQLYFKRPDVTDFELQQLNRRLKRLEDERIVVRHEIDCEEEDEKLMLLKLIKDQLDNIEDEIMSRRPDKPPPKKKQVDLTCLTEAMLHFWL